MGILNFDYNSLTDEQKQKLDQFYFLPFIVEDLPYLMFLPRIKNEDGVFTAQIIEDYFREGF